MRLGMRKGYGFGVFVFVLVILALLVFCANRMENALIKIAHSYANGVATTAISKSAYEIFKDMETDFSSTQNTDRAMIFETDTAKINVINSYLADNLQHHVFKDEYKIVHIPIGSVTGIALFSGMGFGVPVKIYPISCVGTDVHETFTSCGINQVRHSIYLKAQIDIGYSGYMFDTTETVKVNVPITDTVIVGEVPQYYGMGDMDMEPEH